MKFDGEICGGVLAEDASDDFPSKRSLKISFQTSPEVRHQFRRILRQLHSGNRWCLNLEHLLHNICEEGTQIRVDLDFSDGSDQRTGVETHTRSNLEGFEQGSLARKNGRVIN